MSDEENSQSFLNDSMEQNDEDYLPTNKRARRQNRPKVADTWTDPDIEKLIGEVEVRPCIWNAGETDYKSRTKRDSAWNEICEAFESAKTVDRLTAKWQSLRTQYRTSMANAKKTKSGQGATRATQWKFHSQMAFIGAAEQSQTAR